MKGLPLILTFIILGSKSPLYMNRFPQNAPQIPELPAIAEQVEPVEPAEPVTTVANAAEWDALFSSEAMKNVTYTTHTTIDGVDSFLLDTLAKRDGNRLDYQLIGEEGFLSAVRYLPESNLLLSYYKDSETAALTYTPTTEAGWNTTSSFSLGVQFAGRFEKAVYDEENGCYVLDDTLNTAFVYVEDGKLVKLIDRAPEGLSLYQTESRFTDYGTTVVSEMPEFETAVTADEWAHTLSAEGLNHCTLNMTDETAFGTTYTYISIEDDAASLSLYSDPTEANPEGLSLFYAYEPAEEGVYTFLEEDWGWTVTSLDPVIGWSDAVLAITGLGGLADEFANAVYDEAKGCYTFTAQRLDSTVSYSAYFGNGALLCLKAESEGSSSVTFVNYYEAGEVVPYGPFNAVG